MRNGGTDRAFYDLVQPYLLLSSVHKVLESVGHLRSIA